MTCHGCEGMVKITDSRVAKSPTVTFPLAQHRSIVHDSTSKREVSRQTSLLIYSFRSLGSFATWCVSSARRVRSDLHVWRDSVYSFGLDHFKAKVRPINALEFAMIALFGGSGGTGCVSTGTWVQSVRSRSCSTGHAQAF